MRFLFVFAVFWFFLSGCASSPKPTKKVQSNLSCQTLSTLLIGNKDKVHFYYTINGQIVKKYVNVYLFHNNTRYLYPIKEKFYELNSKKYKPMMSYWACSDSGILLRQYAPFGIHFDTHLTPISKYHFISKPDKEDAVIHFVIMKNSFDRSTLWKTSAPVKKVLSNSTKPQTNSTALQRARVAGYAAGKRKALSDIAASKKIHKNKSKKSDFDSYLDAVEAASAGRVVGAVAVVHCNRNRSCAFASIRNSCKASFKKRSAVNICRKAALKKYNSY